MHAGAAVFKAIGDKAWFFWYYGQNVKDISIMATKLAISGYRDVNIRRRD
jgi:hypothetical protein